MSVGTPASLSASAYLTTEALKIKPDRGGYEAREGEQKNKIFLALRRQPQNNKLDILKLEVFVFFSVLTSSPPHPKLLVSFWRGAASKINKKWN